MTKPTTIIYHSGCPDGAGAALAAFKKFGDDAEYVPGIYGTKPPESVLSGRSNVYVVDFSYAPEVMREISVFQSTFGGSMTVIDHHKTAYEALVPEGMREGKTRYEGRFWAANVIFDMNKSGATMAWEFFHPDTPVPEMMLYLEDRDLWRWKMDHSKEISAALKSHGGINDFRNWMYLFEDWAAEHRRGERSYTKHRLVEEGVALLRADNEYVTNMLRQTELVVFQGVPTRVCNATSLFSEVAGALVDDEHPMGAGWYWDGPNQCYRVSLRSRSGFDVSEIAKKFGGGGHAQAAGFQCKELPWRITGARTL